MSERFVGSHLLSGSEQRTIVGILSRCLKHLDGDIFRLPLVGDATIGDMEYSTVIDKILTTIRSTDWSIAIPSTTDRYEGKVNLTFSGAILSGDPEQLKHQLTITALFL